jgi:predicted secreted hydrolase
VTWASHFAITDESGGRFHYAQRTAFGDGVAGGGSVRDGFGLRLTDATGASWSMAGSNGDDRLSVELSAEEAAAAGLGNGLSLDLELRATKPAALHDTDGWIDFGAGGSSYYYSRTAMAATGTLALGAGAAMRATGTAWFDHQWGDFIAVGGGGWDWFAVNLDDGTDLTLSLVRDADGSYPLVYGTLVDADGRTRHLPREAFTVETTDRWVSPASGADYPAGWTIEVPNEELVIRLAPTVAAQELDTRATTGVVYWEGSQRVEATRAGVPLGGEAYVELTGYAASGLDSQ